MTVIEDEGTDGVIFVSTFASANVKLAIEMAEYMKGAEPFKKPVVSVFYGPTGYMGPTISKRWTAKRAYRSFLHLKGPQPHGKPLESEFTFQVERASIWKDYCLEWTLLPFWNRRD